MMTAGEEGGEAAGKGPAAAHPSDKAKSKLARFLGKRCRVLWKDDGKYYEGTIVDVHRDLKARRNAPKNSKDTSQDVVVSRGFFVKYDDDDAEWLEIAKGGARFDEDGLIAIEDSNRLEYYWDKGKGTYEEGEKYAPPVVVVNGVISAASNAALVARMEEIDSEEQARLDKKREASLAARAAAEEKARRDREKAAKAEEAKKAKPKPKPIALAPDPELLAKKKRKLEAEEKKEHAKKVLKRGKEGEAAKHKQPKAFASPAGARPGAGGGGMAVPSTSGRSSLSGGQSRGGMVVDLLEEMRQKPRPGEAKHAELMKNPLFKERYEALTKVFDASGGRTPVAKQELSRDDWVNWRNYRNIFEKPDGWWDQRERNILESLQKSLQRR